jgi:hypothetical protein
MEIVFFVRTVLQPTLNRKLTKTIPVRYYDDQIADIDRIFNETRIPRSVLIRQAVDLLLARYKRIKADSPKRRSQIELAAELNKAVEWG